MFNTTKYLLLCIILLYFFTSSNAQRNNNKQKKKKKPKNPKFIPGPLNGPKRRQGGGGGRGNNNVPKRTNPNAINQRNYNINLQNNNRGNAAPPDPYKIIPPKPRLDGVSVPRAPSWSHCVKSVSVSEAWSQISNEGYPGALGQKQCSWIIVAPKGLRVRLSFRDLDLLVPKNGGCGSQFIEIIDSDLQASQARYCGSNIPGDYVSSGIKLRLDFHTDKVVSSRVYRGFSAGVRADHERPGTRETSYYGHRETDYNNYNPHTQSPVNPQFPARPTRRRVITRTTTERTIPGQNIYGAKNQPRYEDGDDAEKDSMASSSTHLYIIIAVILVILLVAAAAYIFKRFFYKQYKAWNKKRKGEENDGLEMQKRDEIYGNKQTILPGNMPLPPTPNQLATPGMIRRQPGMFNEGFYPEDHMMQNGMMMHMQGMPPSYHSSFENMNRAHSFDDISNGWAQRTDAEPIYEDDVMSLASVASVRSSNRHPDHESFKKQKIMERQNSLRMRRNSIGSEINVPSAQNGPFILNDPYRTHSLYGQQTYGYGPVGDVYGSLPPTIGPAPNVTYPTVPMTTQPMYTSSMTNIPAGNSNNFMMQQYNGRSASVYDLTSAQPDMTSQWSTNLNQRHPSLTSSTNNSTATNPILKKTTPNPQNELAFSALRSAKSMNDLTAINTKLNECVSWTLPSQRRKSFMDVP